jgi:bifunctional DNase/RNase
MIEMELNKIIVDESRGEQMVILKEKKGEKILPIMIGASEAQAIKIKLSGFNPPRPLTHDLLKDTIDSLNGKLEKIVIDKLEDNTFHAKLVIKTNGTVKSVDARPSDSIALALRAKAPIFVEEAVLDKALPNHQNNI